MKDATAIREIKTETGRVYQRFVGHSDVRIDWKPSSPIGSHALLTGGMIETQAGEAVVVFNEKVKREKKLMTIVARIAGRPDLQELATLAESLKVELEAEEDAAEAMVAADRAAKRQRDLDAFVATLPAGYVAIEEVKHNPSAADGYGMTDYRHAGVELSEREVGGLGAKHCFPLGNSYDLVTFVPSTALDVLIADKLAAKAAKDTELAANKAAKTAEREAKIQRVHGTGQRVELERWSDDCDGSASECSTDICTQWAMPDGSITTTRTHTH